MNTNPRDVEGRRRTPAGWDHGPSPGLPTGPGLLFSGFVGGTNLSNRFSISLSDAALPLTPTPTPERPWPRHRPGVQDRPCASEPPSSLPGHVPC